MMDSIVFWLGKMIAEGIVAIVVMAIIFLIVLIANSRK